MTICVTKTITYPNIIWPNSSPDLINGAEVMTLEAHDNGTRFRRSRSNWRDWESDEAVERRLRGQLAAAILRKRKT